MNDKNQNNLNGTDNKISIPTVFNGDPTVAEPSHIDANDVPQDIFVNNQNTSASNGNNIFKIPIETKPKPNMDNSQTTGETNNETMASNMPSENNTQANNQSTNNDSTLDKDNPLPQMNNTDVNDNELIAAYVGEKYSNFKKPFNIFALLFGGAYFFYRKMFLYALLVFIINLLILNVIKITALSLLFRVVLGFVFNKLYLMDVAKKVKKIKYIRSQESIEDLKRICASKGGTSVGQLLLGIGAEILIMIIITIVALLFFGINLFTKAFSYGYSTDTSININNYYAIGVPNDFEDNSSDYEFNYQYGSGFSICQFQLYAVKGYNSPEEFLDKVAGSNSNHATLTINNNSWLTDNTESVNKTYYYATEKDSKVFVIEYSIGPNADSNCSNYKDNILSMVVGK